MKILVTGDSHLGKGQDLGRTPGERLAEQEKVWAATLDLARERGCDALLHAGDLFDGRRPGPDVMLAAERPLVDHHSNADACPVYVVAGNHDVPSVDGPCGLDVLAEAGLIELAREPRSWFVSGVGMEKVAVCALPWTPLGRLIAANGDADRGDLHQLAADLLLQTARDLRGRKPYPTILLGHWSVSQTSLPNGMDVGSLGGVVLPMDDLRELGYDALTFGHIHRPQNNLDGDFLYVGSPQPLDFGEAGCDHGVWLLESTPVGGFDTEFVPLASRPFLTLDLAERGLDGIWARHPVAYPIPGSYVKVRGTVTEDERRDFDLDEIRESILDAGAHRVWFDVTVERPRRDRGVQFVDGQTRADQLAAYLDATNANGTKEALLAKAEAYLS